MGYIYDIFVIFNCYKYALRVFFFYITMFNQRTRTKNETLIITVLPAGGFKK